MQLAPIVLESFDQSLGGESITKVDAANLRTKLVEQDVKVPRLVARPPDAAHPIVDLGSPLGVDEVLGNPEKRANMRAATRT